MKFANIDKKTKLLLNKKNNFNKMNSLQSLMVKENINEESKLNEYLGIIEEFRDPYHLFLKKDDLQEGEIFIHYILMHMGKKKIVFWGIYDVRSKVFLVENGCKYQLKNFSKFYNYWDTDYLNVENTVKNRINKRIDSFTGKKKLINNNQDYRKIKAYLSTVENSKFYNRLNTKTNPKFNPKNTELYFDLVAEGRNLVLSFYYDLSLNLNLLIRNYDIISLQDENSQELYIISQQIDQVTSRILNLADNELNSYESKINLRHFQKNNFSISPLFVLKEITQSFYNFIKYGLYFSDSYYDNLSVCPSVFECENSPTSLCGIIWNGHTNYRNLADQIDLR